MFHKGLYIFTRLHMELESETLVVSSVPARQGYCYPYCITNCVCSYNVSNKSDRLLMQSSLPKEVCHLDSTSLFLLEYLKSAVYVTQIYDTATLKVLHISRN